jgi:multidrug efflux pump subunit AcrA (membrane-fusion protein)
MFHWFKPSVCISECPASLTSVYLRGKIWFHLWFREQALTIVFRPVHANNDALPLISMTPTSVPAAVCADSPPVEMSGAAPDAQRLQAQLAAQAEAEALEPLLQLLRMLLAARTVALVPLGAKEVVVGAAAAGLGKLCEALDPAKAMVLPAVALGTDGYTLAVPIWREGHLHGWLIAQLLVPQARDLQAFVVLLQTFAGYVLYRAQRLAVAELHSVLERTSGLLDLFRRAGGELDFDHACRLALDALCADLGCARAWLGLRRGGAVRVTAISGAARIDSKSVSHQPFEAAMREALSAGQPLDFTPNSPPTDATAAHGILCEQTAAARLLTLPLPRGRGAVLLEWSAPPDSGAALVAEAAAPFVPVLFELLDRARPQPAVFAVRRLWHRATANRRRAVLVAAAALALLLAWPFHYRIGADCRIAPTVKQVVAAPFDGQLRKSFVRPGDAVREGDPLGELDNRELKLKEAELTAARERALKQRDRAMSGSEKSEGADFAAAQMATFEAQSVGQELELVRRKLALLEVKAPLTGVVVSGDLRRAEGQPVPRGQVLWEVAPLDAMIVEIDAPDREISRIRVGQQVRVRLEAFGGGRWESTLRRVHPQSEQRDGRNVFIVEADISPDRVAELRPGMRGRASIQSDRRPLIWIIGHRFWDWLVTTLFW